LCHGHGVVFGGGGPMRNAYVTIQCKYTQVYCWYTYLICQGTDVFYLLKELLYSHRYLNTYLTLSNLLVPDFFSSEARIVSTESSTGIYAIQGLAQQRSNAKWLSYCELHYWHIRMKNDDEFLCVEMFKNINYADLI